MISHWLVPHPIEIQVELAARFDAKILQCGLSQGSVLTAAPRKQRRNGWKKRGIELGKMVNYLEKMQKMLISAAKNADLSSIKPAEIAI